MHPHFMLFHLKMIRYILPHIPKRVIALVNMLQHDRNAYKKALHDLSSNKRSYRAIKHHLSN